MSQTENDQSDLTEFYTGREVRDEKPNWTPIENAEEQLDTNNRVRCGNCNETVSKQFARVFGNNDDEIDRCPDCATYREIKDGAVPEQGERQ